MYQCILNVPQNFLRRKFSVSMKKYFIIQVHLYFSASFAFYFQVSYIYIYIYIYVCIIVSLQLLSFIYFTIFRQMSDVIIMAALRYQFGSFIKQFKFLVQAQQTLLDILELGGTFLQWTMLQLGLHLMFVLVPK